MNQLSLFACDITTLEQKALLVVTLDAEIADLEEQRKQAAKDLKECDEAKAVKGLREQIADAKERRAKAGAELYGLKKAGV